MRITHLTQEKREGLRSEMGCFRQGPLNEQAVMWKLESGRQFTGKSNWCSQKFNFSEETGTR